MTKEWQYQHLFITWKGNICSNKLNVSFWNCLLIIKFLPPNLKAEPFFGHLALNFRENIVKNYFIMLCAKNISYTYSTSQFPTILPFLWFVELTKKLTLIVLVKISILLDGKFESMQHEINCVWSLLSKKGCNSSIWLTIKNFFNYKGL